MAELVGHEGKIAIVVHDQTSVTGLQRRDGFVNYMEENEPNIEIVDIQYGGGDQAKSADLAKAIIAANPDLKGIYGSNEGAAIGVVHAVQELGISRRRSRSSASTRARTRSTRSATGSWPARSRRTRSASATRR